jgi:hypothetical protein
VGSPNTPAERIAERLSAYLGPNTARTAVRSFADRELGVRAETVGRAEAPRLVEALRPMLRTLLGASAADRVVAELLEDLR